MEAILSGISRLSLARYGTRKLASSPNRYIQRLYSVSRKPANPKSHKVPKAAKKYRIVGDQQGTVDSRLVSTSTSNWEEEHARNVGVEKFTRDFNFECEHPVHLFGDLATHEELIASVPKSSVGFVSDVLKGRLPLDSFSERDYINNLRSLVSSATYTALDNNTKRMLDRLEAIAADPKNESNNRALLNQFAYILNFDCREDSLTILEETSIYQALSEGELSSKAEYWIGKRSELVGARPEIIIALGESKPRTLAASHGTAQMMGECTTAAMFNRFYVQNAATPAPLYVNILGIVLRGYRMSFLSSRNPNAWLEAVFNQKVPSDIKRPTYTVYPARDSNQTTINQGFSLFTKGGLKETVLTLLQVRRAIVAQIKHK